MKTLKQINEETQECINAARVLKVTDSEYKALVKRLETLRVAKLYLETNPTKDSVESQLILVERKLASADFSKWSEYNYIGLDIKKKKVKFNMEFTIKELKAQKKMLMFVLDSQ